MGMERKLAAILSTDVQGYSRLMGEDEVATIRTLTAYRELMTSLIQQYRGRVVDSPGDNLLAEFISVVEAVQCAVVIQRELKARNMELPLHRRMEFRIGINLGDVIAEGERIYGDGVNIAARLEGLAEAGGLCISGTVYDQVKTKLALGYEDLGAQAVKNIAEPVRVYRVRLEPGPAAPAVSEQEEMAAVGAGGVRPEQGGVARRVLTLSWRQGALALVGSLLILGGMVAIWPRYFAEKTPRLALPDKPSIAVLPFANMSGDPAQDYFSDGMTEVLITDLSKVADLFVIARNSVFTYKGKAVKPEQVSRELGVRYVLEGSVLKAGDEVGTMANEAHLYVPHCPSTCASAASAWGSQKVISMARYSIHAAGSYGNASCDTISWSTWWSDSCSAARSPAGVCLWWGKVGRCLAAGSLALS